MQFAELFDSFAQSAVHVTALHPGLPLSIRESLALKGEMAYCNIYRSEGGDLNLIGPSRCMFGLAVASNMDFCAFVT